MITVTILSKLKLNFSEYTFTLLHKKQKKLKSRTYFHSVESILPLLLIKSDVENVFYV